MSAENGQLRTDARGCVRCQHLATLQEEWDKREAEIHQEANWELSAMKAQRDELRRERDLVLTELASLRQAFAGTLFKTVQSLDSLAEAWYKGYSACSSDRDRGGPYVTDCPYEEAD